MNPTEINKLIKEGQQIFMGELGNEINKLTPPRNEETFRQICIALALYKRRIDVRIESNRSSVKTTK